VDSKQVKNTTLTSYFSKYKLYFSSRFDGEREVTLSLVVYNNIGGSRVGGGDWVVPPSPAHTHKKKRKK